MNARLQRLVTNTRTHTKYYANEASPGGEIVRKVSYFHFLPTPMIDFVSESAQGNMTVLHSHPSILLILQWRRFTLPFGITWDITPSYFPKGAALLCRCMI